MAKKTPETGAFVNRWTKAIQEMPSTYEHPANAQPSSGAKVAAPKLTPAQKRVLAWIGKGWRTEPGPGSAIHVNGSRICNVDTLMGLQRLGLADKADQYHWVATPAGVAITKELGL